MDVILFLLLYCRRGAATGQKPFQEFVRTRDHVHGNQFANTARRGCSGVGGCFYRANIATHHDRDVAGADSFLADEDDVGGLDIASAASIEPTKPLVSIIPRASLGISSSTRITPVGIMVVRGIWALLRKSTTSGITDEATRRLLRRPRHCASYS